MDNVKNLQRKKIIKDVILLALPAVGEMVLNMLVWVLDTLMVGQYGGNIAVSTVGLSSEILYTFVNVFISVGVSIGITSLVARRYGAKKLEEAEEYATLGFTIGIIIAFIIFVICFIFTRNILVLGGAKEEVIKHGVVYMKICSVSILFAMAANLLNGIFRGYGNTKTPLMVSLIINIFNIFGDWVLIFGIGPFPELGIKGAAIATAFAEIVGATYAFYYMINKSEIKIRKKYINNLNKHKLNELIKLSVPSSLQEGSYSISRLISTFMIMHMGTISFAANQITTTIESLSYMPGWGFAVAATTLVGHKIGENNYDLAKKYAHTCGILGVIIMSLGSILFLTIPHGLISLFINKSEKEVIKLGALCLMIASVEQPPMALSMIYGGALKGAGDTRTPFVISFFSSWLIRLPLMYYAIYILKLPVNYVWWITAIQWGFDGFVLFGMFNKKFEKRKKKNIS